VGSERLHEAFDRIEDFLAVNRGVEPDRYRDAVLCLQKAVGIGERERDVIRERLERLDDAGERAADQVAGLLLGLIIAGLGVPS
jgi:hypothetical protein